MSEALLIGLLIAVYTDIKSRVIPNWLILITLFLGFLNFILNPEPGYLISFGVGVITWGLLFYLKLFGGGDAKLMMVLSFFVLPVNLLTFYLCVLIAGALQALFWMCFKKSRELPYAVAIALGSVGYFILTL